MPGVIEVKPFREREMKRRGGDQEDDARHRAGRDHRHDPERGQRDVNERLEELSTERLREEALHAQALEVGPRFHLAVEVIDHESQQNQPEIPLDGRPDRGPGAHGLEPFQEREPVREANREEELRHDRVGIAAIRIVMLPDGPDLVEPADEVHQQHPGHRVAAELVQRGDSPLGGKSRFVHPDFSSARRES